MKKKFSSRIVRVFNNIINLRSWLDWDRMKSFTLYLTNGFKKFFVPQENKAQESFEEAQARLNLTNKELQLRQKGLFRMSILMLVVAFLIGVYTVYQLFYGSFMAVIVSFILILIALVLAFRYHFWYFQIKKRKLGCTIREWFDQGLRGNK